jgi:hypothetical protein
LSHTSSRRIRHIRGRRGPIPSRDGALEDPLVSRDDILPLIRLADAPLGTLPQPFHQLRLCEQAAHLRSEVVWVLTIEQGGFPHDFRVEGHIEDERACSGAESL